MGGPPGPPSGPPCTESLLPGPPDYMGGPWGGLNLKHGGAWGGLFRKCPLTMRVLYVVQQQRIQQEMSLKLRKFVHIKAILANFYQFRVKFSQVFHTPHHFVFLFTSATKFKP